MTPARLPPRNPSPAQGLVREERLSERVSAVASLILWEGKIFPQTAISHPGRFVMLYSNFGATVWKNGSFPAVSSVGGTAEPIRNQLQLVAQMAPYVRAVC